MEAVNLVLVATLKYFKEPFRLFLGVNLLILFLVLLVQCTSTSVSTSTKRFFSHIGCARSRNFY